MSSNTTNIRATGDQNKNYAFLLHDVFVVPEFATTFQPRVCIVHSFSYAANERDTMYAYVRVQTTRGKKRRVKKREKAWTTVIFQNRQHTDQISPDIPLRA